MDQEQKYVYTLRRDLFKVIFKLYQPRLKIHTIIQICQKVYFAIQTTSTPLKSKLNSKQAIHICSHSNPNKFLYSFKLTNISKKTKDFLTFQRTTQRIFTHIKFFAISPKPIESKHITNNNVFSAHICLISRHIYLLYAIIYILEKEQESTRKFHNVFIPFMSLAKIIIYITHRERVNFDCEFVFVCFRACGIAGYFICLVTHPRVVLLCSDPDTGA